MQSFSEKITFRKSWSLTLRAARLWYHNCPMMFVCDMANTIFGSLSPYVGIWLSARIVDELAGNRDPHRLTVLILITLGSAALISLISLALSRWSSYLTVSMGFFRQKLYADKMLSMDFCKMDDQKTHALIAQVREHDSWSYGIDSAVSNLTSAVGCISGVFGVIVLSFSMLTARVPEGSGALTILNNPLFVALIIIVMLAVTLLSPFFEDKSQRYWNKYADESATESNLNSFYMWLLPRARERGADIRLYRQDKIGKYYSERCSVYTAHSKMAEYARGPMTVYSVLATVCSYSFVGMAYFLVCIKAWAGAYGVGAVTQYIGAVTSLAWCIIGLIRLAAGMRQSAPFLRTVFEFLDLPNVMYQGSLTVEKRRDRNYEIEFRDVSFKYPGSDIWALRHVNLRFRVGEKLAVVGRNGSGKTTFIKLLCRMYDPTEGEILLNGIDIRKYDYREYLSVFSVVFQDFKLFALPLGENVAAGSDYSRDRAKELLCRAGFAERLSAMPDGLDTYLYKDLSDKGVDISGGEAQKIALARALYKDAPFIILDEPTAALDPIAEYEIYSRFNELVGDRTAIYISHRLSSCRFCDVIAVFHEGAVTEHGTHEELVSDKNSKYYELWHAQAQYYTNE